MFFVCCSHSIYPIYDTHNNNINQFNMVLDSIDLCLFFFLISTCNPHIVIIFNLFRSSFIFFSLLPFFKSLLVRDFLLKYELLICFCSQNLIYTSVVYIILIERIDGGVVVILFFFAWSVWKIKFSSIYARQPLRFYSISQHCFAVCTL